MIFIAVLQKYAVYQTVCFGLFIQCWNGRNHIPKQSCAVCGFFHKQTINTALKKMEEDGLICFERSTQNRKKKQIFLTEEGTALAQKTVIPFMEMEKRAFGSLDDKERKEFLRLTQKHLDLLQEELKSQI